MPMRIIRYSIPSWRKFNPRTDRANYSWFRMENSVFSDQAIFDLNDKQKILFFFLVCEASKKNHDGAEVLVSYASSMLGHRAIEIVRNFEVICRGGLLTSECRRNDGQSTGVSPATNETYERDETNETNVTSPPNDLLDFEALYLKYPRRVNKTEARSRFLRVIKTSVEFDELSRAIDAYKAYCIAEKTEAKFIKHMSSFLGVEDKQPWRDWLDPTAGTSDTPPPDGSGRRRISDILGEAS